MRYCNIGILAHVDAGKTSITEQLLFRAGSLRRAGSVDSGTCATDSMKVERRRGISVRDACASAEHNGTRLCFIDTPGHVDFTAEVERSLGVLDGAVLVISAVEGVQAHTKLIMKALRSMNIPTVIAVNKTDRAGADSADCIAKLREQTGVDAFPVQSLSGEGTETCAIAPVSPEAAAEELLLLLGDDSMMEAYLSGEVTAKEVYSAFLSACRSGSAFPVFFTSAKTGMGIEELLDGITLCLPDSSAIETEELSGLVFKVEVDKDMGKGAYIRLFGGTLKNRDTVVINGSGEEKTAQIRRFDGARAVDCGELHAGETGIVYGLSSVRNSDYVGKTPPRSGGSLAVPLLTVTAHPDKEEERPVIMETLRELSDEDPLLQLNFSHETGEMRLNITGVIQLEVLEELIFERCGCRVLFSEPSVIFKETPRVPAVGYESYTMPKPCWAQVELTMEPLPRGSGIEFRSAIKDNIIPYRYQHHVELSVKRDCVAQGIYGWEVVDARITLTGGAHHHIHTHPLDFFVATPVAFLRALTECGSVLLEPFVHVTMSADEDLLGKVMGHIIDMRGEFGDPVIENGSFTIEAELPVQSSMDYPVRFRSLTSGRGIFSSSFSGYRECPKELYKTLPRRTPDPLDKPRWILYCRNCMRDSF